MDGDTLIKAVYEAADRHSDDGIKREMREGMREILRRNGDHVAESTKELRELALAETDLVEPSEDE